MEEGDTLHGRLAGFYELGGTSSAKRNLPMEGLRGLAVILVFFVHYHALFSPWLVAGSRTSSISFFLWSIGHSGVDLFFVLSGYLIYGAVISKRTNYAGFIKRRVERIYPTFLCVLAVYLVLSVLFPVESKLPPKPLEAGLYILENALLLPGIFEIPPIISVAWSLSYEFFYYLLIPLVVLMLGMQRWQRFQRVIFFFTMAILYAGVCALGLLPHLRMIMFLSGILLYEALHSYELWKSFTPRADYWVLTGLVLTFYAIYLLTDRQENLPHLLSPGRFGLIYRELLLFVMFYVFTLACFNSRGLLRKLFSWTPLRWLGNMSYSYYLIHALTVKAASFALALVFPPEGKSALLFWAALPFVFVLTLVSSTLLFLFVEKRFSLSTPAPRPAPRAVLHSVSVPPE